MRFNFEYCCKIAILVTGSKYNLNRTSFCFVKDILQSEIQPIGMISDLKHHQFYEN